MQCQKIEIEGYVIPKNASINFMVAEMGSDEKVWEELVEFKPERFLAGGSGEGVDITGNTDIRVACGLSCPCQAHFEHGHARAVSEMYRE